MDREEEVDREGIKVRTIERDKVDRIRRINR